MFFLISKFKKDITLTDRYESNYPKAISMLIIEQQVSFKAAITIKKRFLTLIKNKNSDEVLEIDDNEMQSIGIPSGPNNEIFEFGSDFPLIVYPLIFSTTPNTGTEIVFAKFIDLRLSKRATS